MRILLDENLPESLTLELRAAGHQVDTVRSLKLKGIDNGELYRRTCDKYDLCFTKDRGFATVVRSMRKPGQVRLLHVTLPQQPAPAFVEAFVKAFLRADWNEYESGSDWP